MKASEPLVAKTLDANSSKSVFRVLSGDAMQFRGLTYPSCACHLLEISEGASEKWFALGAEWNGVPAALALGSQSDDHALLLSIHVAAEFRPYCLEAGLLAAWEEEAARRNVRRLIMRFSERNPRRAHLEALLQSRGWCKPSLILYRLIGIAGFMARAGGAWKGVQERVLRDATVTYDPFQVTEADASDLARLLEQPEAKFFSDPCKYSGTLLPELSFAIRRHGRLVGWLIAATARNSYSAALGAPPSTAIEYKDLYLDAALWRLGYAFGVFYHAFMRQAGLFGENSLALYTTHPGVPRMVALSRRRFAPLAIRFDSLLGCEKQVPAS